MNTYSGVERRKDDVTTKRWSFWKDVMATLIGVCMVVIPLNGTIITWVISVEKKQAVQDERFESFKELMHVQEIAHLQQNADLDGRLKDLRSDIRDMNAKMDRLLQLQGRS